MFFFFVSRLPKIMCIILILFNERAVESSQGDYLNNSEFVAGFLFSVEKKSH